MDYSVKIFENENWVDYTQYCTYPIAINELLDTGLDSGGIQLWNTPITEPFQPFTKVMITASDGDNTNYYYFFISVDNCEIDVYGDGGFNPQSYTHNISLIEPTKILERINVDNLTVTQSKLVGFGGDFEPVSPVINNPSGYFNILAVSPVIGTPYPVSTGIFLPSLGDSIRQYPDYLNVELIERPGVSTTYQTLPDKCLVESNLSKMPGFGEYVTFSEIGDFFIRFNFVYEVTVNSSIGGSPIVQEVTISLLYNFSVTDIQPNTEKTITSELQRILKVTPTRRFFGSYYKLDDPSGLGSLAITKQQIEDYAYYNYSFDAITGEITFKNKVQSFSDITNIGQVLYLNIKNTNPTDSFWTLNVSRIENDYLQCGVFSTSSELIQGTDTQPYFVLDNAIAEKYKDVRCPEFTFTKQTLWEALLQFGDYIHAIPRLKGNISGIWDTITFDFLGLQHQTQLGSQIYDLKTQDIEQYATELDSYIDNLINSDKNETTSSIIEPGGNLFKSVTAPDNEFIVTNDNAVFKTTYPIYELKSLKVKYSGLIVDITKYCFESAEYRLLSDYENIYPYSKAYALEYSIGGNTISQLQTQIETVIGIQGYAIQNILRVEGVNLPTNNIVDLSYQIEYVAITNSRLTQRKQNYNDYDTKVSLFFNQSANMVSSTAYGENLKGTVLRLSNYDISQSFRFENISEIPQIGDVVGEYYITQVNLNFYKDYINATIQFSKDFNRLSKYIGIMNYNRMYEVSERQTVERDINYSANIDLEILSGDNEDSGNLNSILTEEGKFAVLKTFTGEVASYPTVAKLYTLKKDGTLLATLAFPLDVKAIGNSISYSCKFEDNYSAGYNINTNPAFPNKLFKNYIPYNTELGNFKYLSFQIGNPLNNQNLERELPDGINLKMGFGNYEFAFLDSGWNYNGKPKDLLSGAIDIDKESREVPKLTIQLHFTSSIPEIVLGYFLTHNNALVGNPKQCSFYALPYKINKFEKNIDLTNATKIKDITNLDLSQNSGYANFFIQQISIPINCQSIAICNSDGEFYLGLNKQFAAGDSFPGIRFVLK